MAVVSIKDLLEAGAHFGHQKRRWNPKMKPFIFEARNGIYIINLQKTVECINNAYKFIYETVARGGKVLFVGTKKQAKEAVLNAAERTNMHYVTERWLGGMLTNLNTIRISINRLNDLEKMAEDGVIELLPKKECASLRREKTKLHRNLDGVKNMSRTPDAVVVVDPKKEHLAVAEARKLRIPIVGIVDTNCDPDDVDFLIPANDDAMRSIRLILSKIVDAILLGQGTSKDAVKEGAEEFDAPPELAPLKDDDDDDFDRVAKKAMPTKKTIKKENPVKKPQKKM
ncbi:30S ribosomal protein S2 [bacterium]|nr:30S ribosomal protein S2 [bacterium]MCP5462801.1 30S ribosomal protein S2 [bacterium]